MAKLFGAFWVAMVFSTAVQATQNFQDSVGSYEVLGFPEGCGQAYQEVDRFMDFFESSIASMVVARKSSQVVIGDLFAVSELRKEFRSIFPNYTEESPIDRLIITQACQFQKVRTSQIRPGALDRAAITSDDRDLHAHWSAIATRLYKDSYDLMKDELKKRAKAKERSEETARQIDEIRKARNLGRSKISELLK